MEEVSLDENKVRCGSIGKVLQGETEAFSEVVTTAGTIFDGAEKIKNDVSAIKENDIYQDLAFLIDSIEPGPLQIDFMLNSKEFLLK